MDIPEAEDKVLAKWIAIFDAEQEKLALLVKGIHAARSQRDNIEVGRLLWKAKAIVPHGQWQMWLNEIGLPYRYAVNCIKLWRDNRRIEGTVPFRSAAE
jgi:hypothetical protein